MLPYQCFVSREIETETELDPNIICPLSHFFDRKALMIHKMSHKI